MGDRCNLEKATATAYLLFTPDGKQVCDADSIPEGYLVRIAIVVPYKWSGDYSISVEKGASTDATVRGSFADVAAAAKASAAERVRPKRGQLGAQFKTIGPFSCDDITIHIKNAKYSVDASTKLTVDWIYASNLVLVVALPFKGTTEYSVANDMIQSSHAGPELNYLVGLTISPFAVPKVRCTNNPDAWCRRFGRYYTDLDSWTDRINLVAGVSLNDLTGTAYVGLGYSLFRGVGLSVGWLPRHESTLANGLMVGQAFTGDTVPVNSNWALKNFAIGATFDASIAKSVADALK